ncbi:MAG: DUF1109 domain-containing protein [Caulobacterales bacterium]
MKTDDLIAALARQDAAALPGVTRALAVALVVAAGGSLAVLLLGWGLRPDLAQAVATSAYWMKAGYTAAFALGGLILVERLGRPGVTAGRGWFAPALAVLAIGGLAVWELSGLTPAARMADMMGHSASQCPLRIMAISAPAFAAAIWALRRMAPTRPRLAAGAAGLLAGGIGATVYGLRCDETAAAFTAIWYSLGMLGWAGVGALVGPRLLRW